MMDKKDIQFRLERKFMSKKTARLFSMVCMVALAAGVLQAREYHVSVEGRNEKPNILLILIDDMGWKDMGCAGSAYYETPHIDRLASEGLRFVNAYSAAPVCTPSRGAIFSGKCPARTQLTTVFTGPAGPDDRLHDKSKYSGERDQYLEARHRHALPKAEVILAEALGDGGYTTGFFGKWHCGECPGYYPDERGFHVAKGYRTRAAGTSRSGHWMKTFHNYGAHLEGVDRDAYVADVLTSECMDFMAENRSRPFLAVLSHYLVHTPIQPKPDKLAHYKDKPTADQDNPGYAAMVSSVDDSVGRLLEALKKLNLDDNTLVMFTSDNGGLTPRCTSNYPLMGGKSFPFEAGMKVPFIVRWPGKIKPGLSEARVIGMDIYPTMLSAAGQPLRPEQHADGLDLMPLLTQGTPLKPRPLVFHYPHYTHATGPFSSIIEDDWKLIRFYNDEAGANLLYNLAGDPGEQVDQAADRPFKLKKLGSRLDALLMEMKAEMPVVNPDVKPGRKSSRKNLAFTKGLAEKERALFEARLHAQNETTAFYQGPKDKLHVYLLIGQSNMAGRAPYTDGEAGIMPGCYLLNKEDKWEAARNPLNRHSTVRKGLHMQKMNPGYTFAKKMMARDRHAAVGLVVNAKGGTSIKLWAKDTHFYGEAVRRTRIAMATGTLKGILWHQGESDAKDPRYLDKLKALVENLRKDLGAPSLPFVAGQICNVPLINRQIARLPEVLPFTGFAASEGLNTMDRWHFDADSMRLLGERYAKAIIACRDRRNQ